MSSDGAAAAAAAPAGAEEQKAALRKQLEYYFSDSNFRRDRFLRGKVAEDADGFVQLSVLLTFNRVKAVTESVETIAAALENSEELELSSDRAAVRRVKPLPSEDDSDARTVYVKGRFHPDATLDQLIGFFNAHGSAKRVQMRRFRSRVAAPGAAAAAAASAAHAVPAGGFKGSVFVEFATAEQAAAFVAGARSGAIENPFPAPARAVAAAAEGEAAGASSSGAGAAAAAPAAAADSKKIETAELKPEYWARKRDEMTARRAGKGGAAGGAGDAVERKLERIKEAAAGALGRCCTRYAAPGRLRALHAHVCPT